MDPTDMPGWPSLPQPTQGPRRLTLLRLSRREKEVLYYGLSHFAVNKPLYSNEAMKLQRRLKKWKGRW